jgi:hypothetical protein
VSAYDPTEEVADKRCLSGKNRPPGLKPTLISHAYAALEGVLEAPLFHGDARFRGSSAIAAVGPSCRSFSSWLHESSTSLNLQRFRLLVRPQSPSFQLSRRPQHAQLAALQFERHILQGDEAFAGLRPGLIEIVQRSGSGIDTGMN